ncbi:MAG TPA: hypothetical protein VGD77_09110 [Gemmatimonadaceae bacterium]|jgi:hypothetical protein
MNGVTDFEALRARYDGDLAAEGRGRRAVVEARLEQALEAIGWRSAGGEPAEVVASHARHLLAACMKGHRDPRRLARELAELLRSSAAALDGGGASASAFIPAAEDVLRRYAPPSADPSGT